MLSRPAAAITISACSVSPKRKIQWGNMGDANCNFQMGLGKGLFLVALQSVLPKVSSCYDFWESLHVMKPIKQLYFWLFYFNKNQSMWLRKSMIWSGLFPMYVVCAICTMYPASFGQPDCSFKNGGCTFTLNCIIQEYSTYIGGCNSMVQQWWRGD